MIIGDNRLFIQRENCIEVYGINPFPFILSNSICGNTLSTTLVIVDFTLHGGYIYLLNQSNNITQIDYNGNWFQQTLLPTSVEYISLLSTDFIVSAISTTGIYIISSLVNVPSQYMPYSCIPRKPSISLQFLGFFCEEKYILIDLFAESYANIFTEMQTDEEF